MIYAHARDDSPPRSGPFQFRLRTLFVAVTVFCIIAGCLGGLLFNGIARSLEAENTLHAYLLTLDTLTKYVDDTGRWPAGWDEIVSFDRRSGGKLLSWQKGIDDLESRVKVDFQLDLNHVAAMTPRTFSAVKQVPPN